MGRQQLSVVFDKPNGNLPSKWHDFSHNRPIGPDWVHPAIRVRDTGTIGLGLVAIDLIPTGTTVILFGGALMTWRENSELPEDMQDIAYQVDDDIFYGVRKREDLGIGERLNHSCNPNTGFESEMRLVAIREILPGEDVTMDYAICSSMESYSLICKCGDKNCRGIVRGTDWKNPNLQTRLGKYFQPYLRNKVNNRRKHGLAYRVSSVLRSLANLISAFE